MPNLSDNSNAVTREIPVITTDTTRYTGIFDAAQTVVRAYWNSIDSTSGYDKLWPTMSSVIAPMIDAPLSGLKKWMLVMWVTQALRNLMPIEKVTITADGIHVQADTSSKRAPSSIAYAHRRRD
jgi:hypothetical protein